MRLSVVGETEDRCGVLVMVRQHDVLVVLGGSGRPKGCIKVPFGGIISTTVKWEGMVPSL